MIHLLLGIIYLSFISLGLPDALLGSAWPSMHGDLGAPLSYAGLISKDFKSPPKNPASDILQSLSRFS